MRLRFDWGDGDTSPWSALVPSGAAVELTHAWTALGTCFVRAQAIDRGFLGSDWSAGARICIRDTVLDYWYRTYGGEEPERGYAGLETPDGGYLLLADITDLGAGFLLVRTDALGDTLWTRHIGDAVSADGHAMAPVQDGGCVVAGTACTAEGYDIYVVRTDGSGNTSWARAYDRADWDMGYSIVPAGDGGFLVAGYSGFATGDVYLLRLDANGDTVWTRAYAGAFIGQPPCYGLDRTDDNGYVVVAHKRTGGGDFPVWLIRTDANGDTLWTRDYVANYGFPVRSVRQTADGGYAILVGGDFETPGQLIRTDSLGDSLWASLFDGLPCEDLAVNWLEETTDRGFILTGVVSELGGDNLVLLLMLNPQGGVEWWRGFEAGE